jgi:hypothetical protein
MRDALLPSTLVVVLLLLAGRGEVHPPSHVSTLLGAASSGTCAEFREALKAQLEPSGGTKVLIATVADPHASGLAYAFDLGVDAIQRALAQQGYTLREFWLPWRTDSDGGPECTGRPGFISASPSPTEAGPGPQALVVLLVGETATSGVNVAQLRCALRLVGRRVLDDGSLEDCTPLASPTWLGVLGPSFSGTAPSLWSELSRDGPVTVPIVSGSATAKTLELGPTFKRTVLSDDVVLKAMLRFVAYHEGYADGGVREDEIALLVESNTAYGAGLSEAASGIRLQIPFPIGVHRLREEEASAPAPPSPIGTVGLPLLQDKGVGASAVPQFSRTTESYDERRLETTLQSLAKRRIRYIGILATNDLDKLFLARRARAFCPNATLFTLESSLLFTHPDEARVATGMLVASTYPLIPLTQAWTPRLSGNKEVLQTFGTGTAEGIFNAALSLLGEKQLVDFTFPFLATYPPPVWISVVGNGAMWPARVFDSRLTGADGGITPDARQLVPPPTLKGPGFSAAGRDGGVEQASECSGPDRSTVPWGATAVFLLVTGWMLFRTLSFWWVAYLVGAARRTRIPVALLPFGDLPILMALQKPQAVLQLLPLAPTGPGLAPTETLSGTREALAYDAAASPRARVIKPWLSCLFLMLLLGYFGLAFLALVPVHALGSFAHPRYTALAALVGSTLSLLAFNAVGVAWVWRRRFAVWALPIATVVAAGAALLTVLLLGYPDCLSPRVVNRLLWYERSIAFSSGVTSVVPLAALWLGLYVFVRGHLQSLVNAPAALHVRAGTPNPLLEVFTGIQTNAEGSARDVLAKDLHQGTRPRWGLKDALGPLAVAVLPIVVLSKLHRPTLDGRDTQTLLLLGSALLLWALAWSLHRVLTGTDALLRFLRFVALEPAFERLSAYFQTLPPKQYGRFQVLHPDVRLLARLARSFGRPPAGDSGAWTGQLAEDLRTYDRWPAWGSRTFESIRLGALHVAPWKWSPRPTGAIGDVTSSEIDLLGTYLVLIVSWALTSIRNFLLLAGILSACLWVAFVSYPQSPRHLLLVAAWSAMEVCFVIGLVTFVRFERDDVLSKMSRTTEGKVTFDFAFLKSNWALLAGPVLAFVVLEFPQFGRWLSEWAEPLLRTIK